MEQFKHQIQLDSGYFFNGIVLHHQKSQFQDIKIIENKDYGRTLLLDNKVMLCERDEHEYHELIVHPACLQLYNFKNALIIGGGDCFTAKSVLQYPFINVDLVEIDKDVVDVCKEYFKEPLGNIFQNTRFNIFYEDAFQFKSDKLYDYIALDLTDPDMDISQSLYSEYAFEDIKKKMSESSILTVQAASPFDYALTFQKTFKTLSKLFKNVAAYGKYMGMYGTYQYFIYCSDIYEVDQPDYLHIYTNIMNLNLEKMKIYTPKYHDLLLEEYRIHSQFKSILLTTNQK